MAFIDFFDRADEMLDVSADWTAQFASRDRLQVDNNRVESNGGTGTSTAQAYFAPDLGSADMFVQARPLAGILALVTATESLCARFVDEQNFIVCRPAIGASGVSFGKRVAGAFTFWATTTATGCIGVRIECQGTTIRFYANHGSGFVLIHTESNVTDHQTETSAGFRSTGCADTDGITLWEDFANGLLTESKAVGGSITPTGSLGKDIAKTLAGVIAPVGSMLIGVAKTVTGAIAPVGSMLIGVAKTLTGSMTMAGALAGVASSLFSGIRKHTWGMIPRRPK